MREVKVDQTFGEWIVSCNLLANTYYVLYHNLSFPIGYVDSLLEEAISLCLSDDVHPSGSEHPPSLCSQFERPTKADAIKEHRTRFSLQ